MRFETWKIFINSAPPAETLCATSFNGAQWCLLIIKASISYTAADLMHEPRFLGSIILSNMSIERFRLEESCLNDINKYKKLFALVAIAYTLCWAVGITDGRQNPVKVKKHGYPQYSVFRRGLNLISNGKKIKYLFGGRDLLLRSGIFCVRSSATGNKNNETSVTKVIS